MAQKLTLMKNQIMEADKHSGKGRKFGAVKQSSSKNYACTLEFTEQKDSKKNKVWFLVIDSKKAEISVNCENIESMELNEHGHL